MPSYRTKDIRNIALVGHSGSGKTMLAEALLVKSGMKGESGSVVMERVINPALEGLKTTGIKATGMVRHGDVADTLKTVSSEEGASHIIVGRSSDGGFTKRIFGSSTSNLVMSADVPVTVVK